MRLDKNKDGHLQKTEIEKGYKDIQALCDLDMDLQEIMRVVDTNGDGVIDYTEFITAAIDKSEVINKENMMAAFKLID